jgi:hypothetical protein
MFSALSAPVGVEQLGTAGRHPLAIRDGELLVGRQLVAPM